MITKKLATEKINDGYHIGVEGVNTFYVCKFAGDRIRVAGRVQVRTKDALVRELGLKPIFSQVDDWEVIRWEK